MTNGNTLAAEHRPTDEADVERRLLTALSRGDSDAFWTLWQIHAGSLFSVCLREMNGNRADAEDALASAMMKAFAKLPLFAGTILSTQAWLTRLACNLCRDIHRTRARILRASARLETLIEAGPPEAHDVDTVESPIAPRIDLLPDRLREVFVLRAQHQMAYKDIAARLRLSCATARKRMQQARAALRALQNRDAAEEVRTPRPHKSRPPAAAASAVISRTVRVRLLSGSESDVEILLDRRPCRERQKIATLRAYVGRHPSGWKMRLKLADLLYATGAWTEAMDHYGQVLRKRPWLAAVSARLERIADVIAGRS